MNPYESPSHAGVASQSIARVLLWTAITVLVNGLAFVWLSLTICGCHFHAAALLSLIPVFVWALFTSALCKGQAEWLAAGISWALFFLWLYLEWASNVQFYFRVS